jgi:hypothetical protein
MQNGEWIISRKTLVMLLLPFTLSHSLNMVPFPFLVCFSFLLLLWFFFTLRLTSYFFTFFSFLLHSLPFLFHSSGKMRDALNATGRPIYFSLCGWNTWYSPVGYTLGNSWRIAGKMALSSYLLLFLALTYHTHLTFILHSFWYR